MTTPNANRNRIRLQAGYILPAVADSSGALPLGSVLCTFLFILSTVWPAGLNAASPLAAPFCGTDTLPPILTFPAAGLQQELSACEAASSAVFFFSVSASDACDPAPAVVVSPAAGSEGFTVAELSPGSYMAWGPPGSYALIAEASDEAGNAVQAEIPVGVTVGGLAGADIAFACNDTVRVPLDENCQRVLTPDMLAEGSLGCLPVSYFQIEIADADPSNGRVLDGPGVYSYELLPQEQAVYTGFTGSFFSSFWPRRSQPGSELAFSADSLVLAGQSDWAVAAYAFRHPATITFEAGLSEGEGELEVALLDASGGVLETFSQSDTGSATMAWSAMPGQVLRVWFHGGAAGGTAFVTGLEASFSINGAEGIEGCWGVIVAEDLTPPSLACPPAASEATRYFEVQTAELLLSEGSPVWQTGTFGCLSTALPGMGIRRYEVLPFTVSEEDLYTFQVEAALDNGEGYAAVLQDGFSPLSPCPGLIARQQVTSEGSSRIALPLRPGHTYYLLATTVSAGASGSFSFRVRSDAGGTVDGWADGWAPFTERLYCEDISWALQADSLSWTGEPTVDDNCGPVSWSYEDEVIEADACSSLRIVRTFSATDGAGLSDTCVQEINFGRPEVGDVVFPPFSFPISCEETYPVDDNGNPSPAYTGYPFVQTIQGAARLDEVYCNLGATYEDSPLIEVCEGSFKFLRTWRVIDWCAPEESIFNYGQTIKIGDFVPPAVSAPELDLDANGQIDSIPVYSTQPFDCTAAFVAPWPVVSDNCTGWTVFTQVVTYADSIVFNAAGMPVDTVVNTLVRANIPETATDRFVWGIPAGEHFFRYKVTDDCGNVALFESPFRVDDLTEPVADCNEQLNVSLNQEGGLLLLAESVDEGSWDNCGLEGFAIRREVAVDGACAPSEPYMTPWANEAAFTCCDAGQVVAIELLVRDLAGNENRCWSEVFVEDKIDPVCVPPDPVTLFCDEVPGNFRPDSISQLQALFLLPEATDNCGADWEELPPVPQLDDCGVGRIVRHFRAIDGAGNVSENPCTQEVRLEPRHDYQIRFPMDSEALCGVPNPDTIEVFAQACDLLAVSVADTVFSASGDECYKIFRTYRVINWCEYDGEAPPRVVGRDEDCDEQPGDEAVWVVRQPSQAYIDRDSMPANANPQAGEKGTVCDGQTNPEGYWRTVASNGFWQYRQIIKVYDDVPPVIAFVPPLPVCSNNNETCRAYAEYLFAITDNCTPNDLTITVLYDEYSDGTIDSVITDIFGTYPKWKLAGDWPIGEHVFEIRVEDGCGNQAAADMPFEIVDCKAPAPTCISGLSVPLMPVEPQTDVDGDGDFDSGAMTLFATEFIASPYTDCSMPVTYSINRVGEQPSRDQTSLTITCDDLGILLVEIYAWDSADNPFRVQPDGTTGGPNYDYCETFALVTNNLADCDMPLPTIAGAVERIDGIPVPGVEVSLSGLISQSAQTEEAGTYQFESLEPGYDYTLTPSLSANVHNGLTTYDVVLIGQHILGIQPLTSPYQLLAADVNNSGSVSTLDMIRLRQVILSILLEFPNQDSWRFVPRDFHFEDPANPWLHPVPAAITLNDLPAAGAFQQDFIGIKVGDIDLSAIVNPLLQIDERNVAGELALAFEDLRLAAGEEVEVPVWADLSGIQGLQALLAVDPAMAELLAVEPGVIAGHSYNTGLPGAGRLAVSWAGPPSGQEGEQVLLSLRLRARKDIVLSQALSLGQHPSLYPEAYGAGQKYDLMLSALGKQPALPVLTAFPNPANGALQVRYDIPQTGRLALFNTSGQQLSSTELQAGSGQTVIDLRQVPGGVYTLKLQSAGAVKAVRVAVVR